MGPGTRDRLTYTSGPRPTSRRSRRPGRRGNGLGPGGGRVAGRARGPPASPVSSSSYPARPARSAPARTTRTRRRLEKGFFRVQTSGLLALPLLSDLKDLPRRRRRGVVPEEAEEERAPVAPEARTGPLAARRGDGRRRKWVPVRPWARPPSGPGPPGSSGREDPHGPPRRSEALPLTSPGPRTPSTLRSTRTFNAGPCLRSRA